VRLIKHGEGSAITYTLEDISVTELARIQLGLISAGFENIGPAYEPRPPEFRSWSRGHLTVIVSKDGPPVPPGPHRAS